MYSDTENISNPGMFFEDSWHIQIVGIDDTENRFYIGSIECRKTKFCVT